MPTPTRIFAELAARHGGVDPDDWNAVQRWFTESVPNLPRERIEDLLEELLEHQGHPQGQVAPPIYPENAALPRLDASPPVPVPGLARGWIAYLRRLLRGKSDGQPGTP